jgi:tRNA(Ile)-lysidine synthase
MAAKAGVWVRPLLRVSRRELSEYLVERGIEAWNDPANADPRHLRSWLRTAVLPMLGEKLPDITPRLLRAGRQAAAARAAWDQLPELLEPLSVRMESGAISVAAPPLLGYRSELRHAVLAALGRRFGVPLGERRLAAIDRLSASGRGTVRLAATLEAELFDDRLTLRHPGGEPSAAMALVVGAPARAGLAEITTREAVGSVASRSGWETDLAPGQYFVREWRRGDRIRPLAGRGSRAVSVLLREARVPVSRRREWPVVTDEAGTTIVWVPGICRAGASLPEPGTKALHVECAFA